ncbi:MAG: hypothetical protein IJE77_11545 [Thermoguttaceae bacterium]|nr:hypothetical protein [Thermoguttaceae bacterium]MBQ9800258.1 hypothetical protein [Thermoguttaceae bacterium]
MFVVPLFALEPVSELPPFHWGDGFFLLFCAVIAVSFYWRNRPNYERWLGPTIVYTSALVALCCAFGICQPFRWIAGTFVADALFGTFAYIVSAQRYDVDYIKTFNPQRAKETQKLLIQTSWVGAVLFTPIGFVLGALVACL